ncbi:MAG: N-6 DNA methylase [Pseudomonadota bacterium]
MIQEKLAPEEHGPLKRDRRKRLGIYYTRGELTEILSRWVIRSKDDVVLEPSFGGCDFLESIGSQLGSLGACKPLEQIFGCDIDPEAFENHLVGRLGVTPTVIGSKPGDGIRFICSDFLALSRTQLRPSGFDAVIGNPPYIRHHNQSPAQKSSAATVQVDGRANLWVAFVRHAHTFLRPGGHAAWVLPGAALHADYANHLLSEVSEQFADVLAVEVGQRLFVAEGAHESTVVLLAQGKGERGGPLQVARASSLTDLAEMLDRFRLGKRVGAPREHRTAQSFLRPVAAKWIDRIREASRVVRLGDVCDVKIGVVTGANRYFVLKSVDAASHQLPSGFLKPILAKMSVAPGLFLSDLDLETARESGARCLVLDTSESEDPLQSSALRSYLELIKCMVPSPNRTFAKRKPWHRLDLGRPPDAFLSYMINSGPRLVANNTDSTSTNAIHRLYLHGQVGCSARALALASLSTSALLSAELEGRAYGAGLLKMEPSDARRWCLALGSEALLEEAASRADFCLRSGDTREARRIADEWCLGGLSTADRRDCVTALNSAIEDARYWRQVTA